MLGYRTFLSNMEPSIGTNRRGKMHKVCGRQWGDLCWSEIEKIWPGNYYMVTGRAGAAGGKYRQEKIRCEKREKGKVVSGIALLGRRLINSGRSMLWRWERNWKIPTRKLFLGRRVSGGGKKRVRKKWMHRMKVKVIRKRKGCHWGVNVLWYDHKTSWSFLIVLMMLIMPRS